MPVSTPTPATEAARVRWIAASEELARAAQDVSHDCARRDAARRAHDAAYADYLAAWAQALGGAAAIVIMFLALAMM